MNVKKVRWYALIAATILLMLLVFNPLWFILKFLVVGVISLVILACLLAMFWEVIK